MVERSDLMLADMTDFRSVDYSDQRLVVLWVSRSADWLVASLADLTGNYWVLRSVELMAEMRDCSWVGW